MKAGNFTGIKGIPNQDIAMWESMGPISDRSKERVGVSDIAVNAFRRLMVDAARAMREGKPAIGTTEPRFCTPPSVRLRAWYQSRRTGAVSGAAVKCPASAR
jgi:LigXa C-terminal domain like